MTFTGKDGIKSNHSARLKYISQKHDPHIKSQFKKYFLNTYMHFHGMLHN